MVKCSYPRRKCVKVFYKQFWAVIIVRIEKLANVDVAARKGEQVRIDKVRGPGADRPLHRVFEVGKTGRALYSHFRDSE